MTLLRYDWSLMNRLNHEFERALSHSGPVALIPRVEVREEAGRYLLRADLPGVAPADIDVTTEEGVLSIKALRRTDADNTESAATYQRRFALPEDADADQVTARSVHGVLEISINKLAKALPRRIAVEAA
ncbi:MAG: hypothetical protein RL412_1852 [Pseudomonadota bacterium]|jgi:HSP20 family protein